MHARPYIWLSGMIALVGVPIAASADNFAAAHYDMQTDELVVTMRYRGTNSNHGFTVKWGRCKKANDNPHLQQIAAVVVDDQWDDAARTSYQKTVRFGLSTVSCRPAEVTLQTAPRFRYTLTIPAAPGQSHAGT